MAATLIVQDDFGQTANANAYITVAFFKQYCDNNGYDYSAYSDDQISIAIIRATAYMDTRWRYFGIRAQIDQTTEWPRYNISDVDNNPVNGIVLNVQKACAEYSFIAAAAALNPAPTRDETGARLQARTTQVGPILDSVRFAGSAIFTQPTYPIADGYLKSRGYVMVGNSLIRG